MTDYFVELTTTEVKEFFRPHLFVNTPDINPHFLQTSGRPGFLIRAALAATLSGLWGMYSGFELCEAAALPGREEYLNSEKYEIRPRDYNAPGNIIDEISKLNRIRSSHPALQSHLGLRFYPAHNDQIIFYGKPLPAEGDLILAAVSLDPFHVQEATIEVPLWEWQLPDDASANVHDLMRDTVSTWHGKLQRIRLDPADLPFACGAFRRVWERDRWTCKSKKRQSRPISSGTRTRLFISCTLNRTLTATMTASAIFRGSYQSSTISRTWARTSSGCRRFIPRRGLTTGTISALIARSIRTTERWRIFVSSFARRTRATFG